MPTKVKKIDVKTMVKLGLAASFLLIGAISALTIWFVYWALYVPVPDSSLGDQPEAKIEPVDTALLDSIELNLENKTGVKIPDAKGIRDPFLLPAETPPPGQPAASPPPKTVAPQPEL